MTDTLDAIAREIEADAHHWRRLAIQENREGNTEAAAAYEICAGQLDEYVTKLTALSNQGEGVSCPKCKVTGDDFACQCCGQLVKLHPVQAEADRRDAELSVETMKKLRQVLSNVSCRNFTALDERHHIDAAFGLIKELDAAIEAATHEQT